MNVKNLFRIAAAAASVIMLAGAVSAHSYEAIYIADGEFSTAIDTYMYQLSLTDDSGTPDYHSDYGYRALGNTESGTAKQKLYNRIDIISAEFHSDYTLDAPANGGVAEVDFAALGLTESEAIEVWKTYRNDHPLYYWMSNSVMYNKTVILLLADENYRKGSERERCNELIETKLADYIALTEGETSAYRIALAYHDAIIEAVDYAYEKDGKTPQNDSWAHNIMGVMEEKGSVCEGFARTYQLLLNLSGIENIFITGRAGEDHAWNLVQLDDDEWYWCDLTWDDNPDWMWGVRYNYFCVNDEENVMWTDGGDTGQTGSFIGNHTPDSEYGVGVDWLYQLPARASGSYTADDDEFLLRENFTAGQFTCAVAGYNTVQITGINCTSGDVVIPETVEYNGVTYDVISVGKINEDGLFTDGAISLSGEEPKTVNIPESVIFIWDKALCFDSVESYLVDADNQVYSSDDGVLFTKSGYTLIAYPGSRAGVEYTIPDETCIIAYNAFEKCAYLEKLNVGAKVEMAGAVNMGDRYCDNEAEAAAAYFINGEWSRIGSALTGNKEITVDPDNMTYLSADGILYEKTGNNKFAVLHAAKNIESAEILSGTVSIESGAFANCTELKSVVLPEGLKKIQDYAFFDCRSLEEVTIPASVTLLGQSAFAYCTSLKNVYFEGTAPADWGSDVFGATHADLTLYYPADNPTGWDTPEWTAPDGVTYKTRPFKWITDPETGEKIPQIMSDTVTVRGSIRSYGNEEDPIQITLIPHDPAGKTYRTTVVGNEEEYVIEEVQPGAYTLRVVKKNHAAREYEIVVREQ